MKEFLKGTLAWIAGLGALGPPIFIAVYVLATVLFIPGSILTIGAGVLFGVIKGTIYVSIGATIGATCAFLAGRYLARDWVARKLEGNPIFEAIDEAIARESWKIVGLTRLSPAFPFNLLNYALGLTRISLTHYFFASWAGMIPGIVMYTYIGSLTGDLAKVASDNTVHTPVEWTLRILGLLATTAVTVYVTRIARKALRERTAS